MSELRRRWVFRVAAVYATVGFVLVQAADYLFRALLFPPWAHRLVVVLVALGFPLALILAWAFEVTPEGVYRTRRAGGATGPGAEGEESGEGGDVARPGRSAVPFWAGAALLAAAAAGVFVVGDFGGEPAGEAAGAGGAGTSSIAVLPFADLSPTGDQQFFSDGMSEEILDALSRIEGLLVAARTSSFRFRGGETDARAIGDSLGVAAVLNGSVARDGQAVRVRARLVSASDGYQLWTETYTRRLDDVFAIQEEIARSVVRALEVRLASSDDSSLAARPTEDLEAYDLYLRGRYQWNRRTVDGIRRGMERFREALDLDPGLARAWAGLADSHVLLSSFGVMDPEEGYERAREAAERALEIRELAEAHASLGAVSADYDWRLAEAEEHYRRAIELDPNYPTARYWYAEILADVGRTEEAVSMARRAQELDPLSLLASATEGRAYYLGRRFDEAAEKLEETLDRGPQLTAYLYLGLTYTRQGRHERAVQTLEEGRERYAGVSTVTGLLGYALARAGRTEEARRLLGELVELREERPVAAIDVAAIHVGLGDREAALEWLRRAYEERNWQLRFLGTEPLFDPLRSEPRFRELLEDVHGSSEA